MPVTLVADPADVDQDPDVWPWVRRLKYATVAELLADYEASNTDLGRAHCPATEYLRAHLGDDILEVEAHVYGHPEWGPWALTESLHRTLMFNHAGSGPHGAFQAAWNQHYLALHLVRHHRYDRARGALEQHLKMAKMRFVSPAAAYVILAYLNGGHPNPRKLLEKPEIARHFPGIETHRFAAPAFDPG